MIVTVIRLAGKDVAQTKGDCLVDPIFASVIIFAITTLVALAIGLVAIAYRQKDIAALALKILGKESTAGKEAESNSSS